MICIYNKYNTIKKAHDGIIICQFYTLFNTFHDFHREREMECCDQTIVHIA